MRKVELPSEFTDLNSIHFLRECTSCGDDDQLALDFSKVRFVFPFATLLLAEGMRQVFQVRSNTGQHVNLLNPEMIHESDSGALGYLKYFGFFQHLGINIGLSTKNRTFGGTYVPIKIIKRDDMTQGSRPDSWHDTIDETCDHIASLISADLSTLQMISYCFREIIRNVFEHAGVDECSLMAQYYPRNKIVEIAIFDAGIGVCASLKNANQSVTGANFLQMAILPGLTSKPAAPTDDRWANTGFGLYVISELGRRFGTFAILSSGQYMMQSEELNLFEYTTYQGTGIRLKVSLRDSDYFPNILKSIVEEGEEKSLAIFGVKKKASAASGSSGSTKRPAI